MARNAHSPLRIRVRVDYDGKGVSFPSAWPMISIAAFVAFAAYHENMFAIIKKANELFKALIG